MALRQGEQTDEAKYHHEDVKVAEVRVFDEVMQSLHRPFLSHSGFNTDTYVGHFGQRIFTHVLLDDKAV